MQCPRVFQIWLFACALATLVTCAWNAEAQSPPQLKTKLQRGDVEVGERFTLQLSAMVEAGRTLPGGARLPTTPGVTVRSGPSMSTKTQVSITGSGILQLTGIVASWQLEALTPGTYRLGPPSVIWNGRRYESNTVQVTARPRGSGPRRRPRGLLDPFDMFDIFGVPKRPRPYDPFSFDSDFAPPTEPDLGMDVAPQRMVFLRASVDKTSAVPGEQVTLTVHQYFRSSSIQRTNEREPSVPDFLQRSLLEPTDRQRVKHAQVGDAIWRVAVIRKLALFPLKTGRLAIGPMQATLLGMGFRGKVERKTDPMFIMVRDTPAAGRPTGFRAGDVGSFHLTAKVEPRKVEQGGSVGVTVRLEGTGNLPNRLQAPSRRGVEWLDPQTRDDIGVVNDRVRGWRTFEYVVRLKEPGQVDLGEIRLPYYDPDAGRYETEVAKIGTVSVSPNAAAAASVAPLTDRYAAVGDVRTTLSGYTPRGKPLSDHIPYWIVLLAAPLSVLGVGAGASGMRRMRNRMSSWRTSLDRQAAQAMREARRAMRGENPHGVAVAVEKAVHASVESAVGVKSRGLLREELGARLEQEGIRAEVATGVVELLGDCETLRFDPELDGAKLEQLLENANAVLKSLPRRTKKAA